MLGGVPELRERDLPRPAGLELRLDHDVQLLWTNPTRVGQRDAIENGCSTRARTTTCSSCVWQGRR